jgi:hypothetical protein
MQDLRQPMPQNNEKWIPILVYKNGEELIEVSSYQSAYRYLRGIVSCSNTELRDAIADDVFRYKCWNHNGDCYDFRTYEDRRQKFLQDSDKKKQTKNRKSE